MIFFEANSYARPANNPDLSASPRPSCSKPAKFLTEFGKVIFGTDVSGTVEYVGNNAKVTLIKLLNHASGRFYNINLTETFVCDNGQWKFEKVFGEYTEKSQQRRRLPEDANIDLWGYSFTGIYESSSEIRYECRGNYKNRTRVSGKYEYTASGKSDPQTTSSQELQYAREFKAEGRWKTSDPEGPTAYFSGLERVVVYEAHISNKDDWEKIEAYARIDKPEPKFPLFKSVLGEYYHWKESYFPIGTARADRIVANKANMNPELELERQTKTAVNTMHYTPRFELVNGAWELVQANLKIDHPKETSDDIDTSDKDNKVPYTTVAKFRSLLSVNISGQSSTYDYWFAGQSESSLHDGTPRSSELKLLHTSPGMEHRGYERTIYFPSLKLNTLGFTSIKLDGLENLCTDNLLKGLSRQHFTLPYDPVIIVKQQLARAPLVEMEQYNQKLSPEVKARVEKMLDQAKLWERHIPDELNITGDPELIETLKTAFGVIG